MQRLYERLSNDDKGIDMGIDHGLEMCFSCRPILVLLPHEPSLGHKATRARNNICSTTDEDALWIRGAEHWFNRFPSGNCELVN